MTKHLGAALVAILVATAAGADDKAAAATAGDGPMVMQRSGHGQATSKRVVKLRAKVTAVDVANRRITLQGPKGNTETFKVSDAVKRLDEIQVGDDVDMQYEQGLVLQFQQPSDKDVEPSISGAAERAGQDQAPAGAAAVQVRSTVTVASVDQKSRVVVLEGPAGNQYKVKDGPEVKLKKVKAGMKFYAVYTESLAIAIEKPKAKPAPAAPAK